MLLCEAVNMRTTIDFPEPLFRKTKAVAALRGSTLKDLVIRAVEKEVSAAAPTRGNRVELPLVKLSKGKKIDLTGFNFDYLLA